MTGKIEMAQEHLRQAAGLLEIMKDTQTHQPVAASDAVQTVREVVDAIGKIHFRQEGGLDWAYDIMSKRGTVYLATYSVLKFGFVIERLFTLEGGKNRLVLERDIKVGWNYKPTIEDVINSGGKV